jgi:hypothetical protein
MYMPYKDVIRLLRDIKANIRVKTQDEQEAFILGAIKAIERMDEEANERHAEIRLAGDIHRR